MCERRRSRWTERASSTIARAFISTGILDRATLKETVWAPTGTLGIWVAAAHNLRGIDIGYPLEVRAARAATEPY